MILNYSLFEQSDISKNSNFLFYGENQGRVEECSALTIKSVKNKFEKVSLIYFSTDDLKKGIFENFFFDSLNEDIFGSKKVLIVSLQDQKASKEIIDTLKKNISSSLILIIKCSQLKKNSALRNFFENSKDHLTIPCYEETENDKKNIVRKIFNSENLNISEDEIKKISAMLSNQKLEIENELNKLIIYLKTSKKNLRDSLNIVSKNLTESINRLVFLLVSRDKENFLMEFFKSKEIQNDPIRLINYLSDHLLKILEVKTKVNSGQDKNYAIKRIRPPIFFKDIPEFSRQIDLWSENEIYVFLRKLFLCQMSSLKGLKSGKFQLYFLFLKILNNKSV